MVRRNEWRTCTRMEMNSLSNDPENRACSARLSMHTSWRYDAVFGYRQTSSVRTMPTTPKQSGRRILEDWWSILSFFKKMSKEIIRVGGRFPKIHLKVPFQRPSLFPSFYPFFILEWHHLSLLASIASSTPHPTYHPSLLLSSVPCACWPWGQLESPWSPARPLDQSIGCSYDYVGSSKVQVFHTMVEE